MPRWARTCTQCYSEVEDAEHVLLRCPAYDKQRSAFFWLGSGLERNIELAAREVLRGQRGQEHVLWKWMMGGGQGTRMAMEYLEHVLNVRAELVRQYSARCRGQDQGTLVLHTFNYISKFLLYYLQDLGYKLFSSSLSFKIE